MEREKKRFLVRPSIHTLTDLTLPNRSSPPFLCPPYFFNFYFLLFVEFYNYPFILDVGPISRVRVGFSAQAAASV